jgi:NADH-quinone oxidoreductase subunit H
MYLMAEFLHMITAAFLIVILFLGGWHLGPLTGTGSDIGWGTALLRVLVLLGKVFLVVFGFMMIRWTLPRFRFDQLMALAWKVLLPLGLINLVLVATLTELSAAEVLPPRLLHEHPLIVSLVMIAIAAAVFVAAAAISPVSDRRRRQQPGTLPE